MSCVKHQFNPSKVEQSHAIQKYLGSFPHRRRFKSHVSFLLLSLCSTLHILVLFGDVCVQFPHFQVSYSQSYLQLYCTIFVTNTIHNTITYVASTMATQMRCHFISMPSYCKDKEMMCWCASHFPMSQSILKTFAPSLPSVIHQLV